MINKKYIYFISLVSIVFNQESIILNKTNLFNFHSSEHLFLHLEPYKINSYILNKYYPHSIDDYYDNGYFIDGSFNLPTFHLISEQIFFNQTDDGTISQLSYKQKKTDLYFDTKISIKFDLTDSTDFIVKSESKSLTNNINQNHILFLTKQMNNKKLDFGYMYHVEESPRIEFTTYQSNNLFFETISNKIESFHSGINYDVKNLKYLVSTQSSIQISKNKRLLINDSVYNNDQIQYPVENDNLYNEDSYFGQHEYDQQVFWNNNYFTFNLSEKLFLRFSNKYKRNLYEYMDESNSRKTFTFKKDIISSFIEYQVSNEFDIIFGCDRLNGEYKPRFNISYIKNNVFKYYLVLENDIINDLRNPFISKTEYLIDNNNISFQTSNNYNPEIPNLKYEIATNYRMEFLYKAGIINQKFSFGKIKTHLEEYNFYFSDTFIHYKWFYSNLEYKKYDANFLFLKDIFKYSISLMPKLEERRFDPYVNISSTYIYTNENYDIKLQSLYLFEDKNIFDNNTGNNVMLFDFEFGFVFDSFKISFIRKNSLGFDSEVINGGVFSFVPISNEIKYMKYDYVELIWIFKE